MKYDRRLWLIKIILLIVLAVCVIRMRQSYYLLEEHDKEREALKGKLMTAATETAGNNASASDTLNPDLSQQGEMQPETLQPDAADLRMTEINELTNAVKTSTFKADSSSAMLKRFELLYEENNDLVGWLSIEGMVIDYPVVQNEDVDYYLHHNFYEEEDKYGCLFVKETADVNTPGTNFVIYGHNMRDGAMFGDLDLYRDEDFYREHSTISFDTLYEERTYEIIAVFESQVYSSEDETFKYYQFYDASTQEEFETFYQNIKELTLYDTGVTAEFGDTFLTLSTCSYHVDDGRLVVVAKRIIKS